MRQEYLHVAGHYDEGTDLKIDTHGAPVIDTACSSRRGVDTASLDVLHLLAHLLNEDFQLYGTGGQRRVRGLG